MGIEHRGSRLLRIILTGALCLLTLTFARGRAHAEINLELRPMEDTVLVGDTVGFGLYAVSDDPDENQSFSATQTIIAWEPAFLTLTGLDDTGAAPLLVSAFPPDPYGLNEDMPPQDGDAMHVALAFLGQPIDATPDGTLITTFQFQAIAPALLAPVDILRSAGDPPGQTIVFDGKIPGLDVTGTLAGAAVTIIPAPAASPALLILLRANRRRHRPTR